MFYTTGTRRNSVCVTLGVVMLVFFAVVYLKGLHETIHEKVNDIGNLKSVIVKGVFENERKSGEFEQSFEPLVFSMNRIEGFDYQAAMDKLNEEQVAQDDPRLIELIRNYYIVPPSRERYNLTEDKLDYSMGQAPIVDSRLNYMEGGFYVECGACDGEWGTNSLFFEKVRKWNGVLIEADPTNFQKLLNKNRKAFMINACLSTKPYPSMMVFKQAFNQGKIVGDVSDTATSKKRVKIQCFPLYSILLALNQLRVDYFSLDVEGAEMDVLNTIPFDKVDIKMMSVEYLHGSDGADGLKSLGGRKGYNAILKLYSWNGRANDIIFKKRK